jgi:putative transposase
MFRPLRIVYEGAWYPVMNRGAGQRTIFQADAYRQLFWRCEARSPTPLG